MRRGALPTLILTALASACASSGAVGVGTVTNVVHAPRVLPNSVVRLNPKTLTPVQVVRVGDAPDLIVRAGGYLWVTHHILRAVSGLIDNRGDRTLTRVNPATGQVRVVGNGLAPCGLSADPPGAVLVANCFPSASRQESTITRVDARTLKFTGTWNVAGSTGFFRGVGYGGRWVWTDGVADDGRSVIRINPRTGAKRSIPVARNPGAFAWSARYRDLWINNYGWGSLTRLHPKNDASAVTRIVAPEPVFPVIAGDSVWVGDWALPRVERVALSGSQRPQNVRLLRTRPPAVIADSNRGVWNIAAGAGYVWATTPRFGALWRIDPRTDAVKRIDLPYYPTGVTANRSGVWVTVRGKWE